MCIRVLFNFVRCFGQNCTGSNSGDTRQTGDRFGLKTSSGKYVFPETANKMEAHIRQVQKKGENEKFVDVSRLAEKLTPMPE